MARNESNPGSKPSLAEIPRGGRARISGWILKHGKVSDPGKSFQSAGADRARGLARRKERGWDYLNRGLQDSSRRSHSRGVRRGAPPFRRESRAGMGREAKRDCKFGRDLAPDWTSAKQQSQQSGKPVPLRGCGG